MGLVQTLKTERLRGSKVQVDVEVITSGGRITYPVIVDDQGSAGPTEHAAFQELERLLDESLTLVRRRLA
jgi:hypothetical protein